MGRSFRDSEGKKSLMVLETNIQHAIPPKIEEGSKDAQAKPRRHLLPPAGPASRAFLLRLLCIDQLCAGDDPEVWEKQGVQRPAGAHQADRVGVVKLQCFRWIKERNSGQCYLQLTFIFREKAAALIYNKSRITIRAQYKVRWNPKPSRNLPTIGFTFVNILFCAVCFISPYSRKIMSKVVTCLDAISAPIM